MKKIILVIFMCLMICSCKNNNVFKKDANMLIINNLSDKDVKEKLLLERDNEEEIDEITNYFYKSKKISTHRCIKRFNYSFRNYKTGAFTNWSSCIDFVIADSCNYCCMFGRFTFCTFYRSGIWYSFVNSGSHESKRCS